MIGAPDIAQFGIFDAGLEQVTKRVVHHLERLSRGFHISRGVRNDWPIFFDAKGNLFDETRARIFVFERHSTGTVFVCNLSDGWHSLFWNLAGPDCIDGVFFQATIGSRVEYGVHGMEVWHKGQETRHIRALQEDRGWEFLNEGAPLQFERTADLNKRRITDRFNAGHVKLYCREFGVELEDAYSYPGNGTLISRTKS